MHSALHADQDISRFKYNSRDEKYQDAGISFIYQIQVQVRGKPGSYLTITIFEISTCPCTVTDIDGNVYQTIQIGDQCWMAENLKVTHYRNWDPIPNITSNSDWYNLITGAYCDYDNDVSNAATYGRIYNWFAVSDERNIAPAGWHVPSDEEWKKLEVYLGMSQSDVDNTGWRGTNEGGKLKEIGTTHWISPNIGATNESGFSALPGGRRYYKDGHIDFNYIGTHAYFWTSSVDYGSGAWRRLLDNTHASVYRRNDHKRYGFYVRCVKN